jgi:hypothetical protein
MNGPDLSFQLNINCDTDFYNFVEQFKVILNEFNVKWEKSGVGSNDENWIEIDKNFEYNRPLVNTDDGWMYYPYIIRIFSKRTLSPSVDDYNRQLLFAETLIKKLNDLGYDYKIHAEFIE